MIETAAAPVPKAKVPMARTFCLYNRDVTPEDLDNVDRRTTAIVIDNCTSDDWHAVITRITQLKQVTSLTATRCGLDDLQVHPLYAMDQLLKLVLDGNELRSGCGYWTTGTLKLQELSLANNPLNDAQADMQVFEVLRTLPDLKVMKVPMPKLKKLGMGLIEQLTDEVLERVLQNTPAVEQLQITSTKLSEVGILHLTATLKNLRHLAFGKCKAARQCLQIIAESLPELKHLNLLECDVNDKHVSSIVKLKQLTYLGLQNNNITNEGVTLISANLLELQQLNLGKNSFDDKGMKSLVTLTKLKRLSTIGCKGTSATLFSLVNVLTNLEELWVNDSKMSDWVALAIARRLSKLVKLFVSNSDISDFQLMTIVKGLPRLDSLVIKSNRNITKVLLRNIKLQFAPTKCYILADE